MRIQCAFPYELKEIRRPVRECIRYAGIMFTGVFKDRTSGGATAFAAQEALARILRNKRLAAHRFERRAGVGPFIVDYVCREQALIVELLPKNAATSAGRLAFLTGMGYRVLQFARRDIEHPRAVCARIESALRPR